MNRSSSQRPLVGPEFLARLRSDTESRWATHVPRDFQAAGVSGLDWATGTKWRGGLTESQIDDVQRQYGLVFPRDYRRFLLTLHTPDPDQIGAFYQGHTLVPETGRSVYDWTGDPAPIRKALAWPLEGLLWSVEADDSWHPNWGERPESPSGRAATVRQLVEAGPPLIPVLGHRYLVGAPLDEGNPVLSIYGSDVIVYSDDLESCLAMDLTGQPSRASRYSELEGILGIWWDVITGG
jgi:hypothetical protein